jgi:hypothetical protein
MANSGLAGTIVSSGSEAPRLSGFEYPVMAIILFRCIAVATIFKLKLQYFVK